MQIREQHPLQVLYMIYKTLIRPVLLYGSEMWVLIKREENRLFRMIYGPEIVDGVYVYRSR
jgi:hypothetical protein